MTKQSPSPVARVLVTAAVTMLALGAGTATAAPRICDKTTNQLFRACVLESQDDAATGRAICLNITDPEERDECREENAEARGEAFEECRDIRDARNEVCDELGQAAYDPIIDPENFVDEIDNPYAPFRAGAFWEYEGETDEGTERVLVEVLEDTREIAGVDVTIVRDRVFLDGELVEDTQDWVAQDSDGNVIYFGEAVIDYEDGIPVSTDGSFEHGVDGAKAGIWVAGSPFMGQFYRQEWAPGDAEDMVEVLDIDSDEDVPFEGQGSGPVLRTRDYTPLDPGDSEENKFYVHGIGLVREVNLETGETLDLIDFSL